MKKEVFCRNCGTVGGSKRVLAGNEGVDVIAWIITIGTFLLFMLRQTLMLRDARIVPSGLEMERTGILFFFWLLFFLATVFYTLYRRIASKRGCGKCASTNVIPTDTPIAMTELRQRQ